LYIGYVSKVKITVNDLIYMDFLKLL
jgi:hypothetical protein